MTPYKLDTTGSDDNADWLKLIGDYQARDLAAHDDLEAGLVSEKHLKGQHNQKRHGWRFGDLAKVRRGLRAGVSTDFEGMTTPEDERLAYRKRAGLPAPPAKRPRVPELTAAPKIRTGADVRQELQSALHIWEAENDILDAANIVDTQLKRETRLDIAKIEARRKPLIEAQLAPIRERLQNEHTANLAAIEKKYPWRERKSRYYRKGTPEYNQALKLTRAYNKEWEAESKRYSQAFQEALDNIQNHHPLIEGLTRDIQHLQELLDISLTNSSYGDLHKLPELRKANNQRLREAAIAAMATKKPTRLETDASFRDGTSRDAAVKEGADLFNRIVSEDVVPAGAVVMAASSNRSRASYGYQVNMTSDSGSGTFLHELGHWMEDKVVKFGKAAQIFLARRTTGEQPVSLKALTGRNFRKDERTRKDKFVDPYMGKIYQDGSTEIMSMFFTAIFGHGSGDIEPWAFTALLKKDPEYFDFVYDALQGRFPSWMDDIKVGIVDQKTGLLTATPFKDIPLSYRGRKQ